MALHTKEDNKLQKETEKFLEKKWGVEVHGVGEFSPFDGYVVKGGRYAGIIEIKVRKNSSKKYDTVYLSLRKYLTLLLNMIGTGTVSKFVVRFDDGVYSIDINKVNAGVDHITIAGREDRGHKNDVEPIILVPIDDMKFLGVID